MLGRRSRAGGTNGAGRAAALPVFVKFTIGGHSITTWTRRGGRGEANVHVSP